MTNEEIKLLLGPVAEDLGGENYHALNDHLGVALNILHDLMKEREWRPAETAPRDGTRFFAIVDGKRRLALWGKTSHIPLWGFILVDQGAEDCDLCEPTHWMPLPLPPKGSEQ